MTSTNPAVISAIDDERSRDAFASTVAPTRITTSTTEPTTTGM